MKRRNARRWFVSLVPRSVCVLLSTLALALVSEARVSEAQVSEAPVSGDHMMPMAGALGAYPTTREASGTSWQPDSSTHAGLHIMAGDWMFMAHALINGVYDWQGGLRGDEKYFVSGMIMGAGRRTFQNGDILNVRAMLSPEPFMGRRGYPLIFANGETADGVTALIDRQHPHDLFTELSSSYSHTFADDVSAFVYFGLPGEPAFGPPAFMHRASIMDSPEAPISHHWLDSTHIVFGVATVGISYADWRIEASQFTGREPDEDRYNIDRPRFDSTSARVSWNPVRTLALQVSWAHLHSPEQLHPLENENRWSASAIYTIPIGADGQWSTTFAWGRKNVSNGLTLDAWVLESAIKPAALWTFYARGERVDEAELELTSANAPPQTVRKASFGLVRDFRVGPHTLVGVGGQYAFNWPSTLLEPTYGGDPHGAMIFLRLKIE